MTRARALAAVASFLLLGAASIPTSSGLVLLPTTIMAAHSAGAAIYLARHGQDEDNASGILNGRRDTPLTAVGIGQARAVAEKIRAKGLTFDAVYSSPLRRATQTAEIICDAPGRPRENGNDGDGRGDGDGDGGSAESAPRAIRPVRMDDLIERDFGVMTGAPASGISRRCGSDVLRTDTVTYFLGPEGAETFPDLMRRADGVLERIRADHPDPGTAVLLVTHGDFGKMLYASFYCLDWRDALRRFHFGNSEVLLLSEESSPEEAHVFEVEQHNH